MKGSIVQVSISAGGVPNHAIECGVVTPRGIEGDGWRHPQFHGTRRRAILLTTEEGLAEIREMGFAVYPGSLGENVTIRGLDRRALRIGQQLRCGTSLIELTEARLPCHTLNGYGKGIQEAIFDALCMRGDPLSPVWGLSGFYASVIEPGILRPDDDIHLLEN